MSKSAKNPAPPAHLSPAAKTRWKQLVAEYSIEDDYGLMLVEKAMESWDRATRARIIIEAEGEVIPDARGGRRPHPAVGIERDAKKSFLEFIKALNVDVVPKSAR